MKTGDLVRRQFPTVSSYASVASIEDILARERYVVVKDEERFVGILTPADTLINPHRLVIDCVTAKPAVDFDADLNEAFALMESDSLHVLPVVKENEFVGIVRDRDILNHILERNRRLQAYIDSIENRGGLFEPSPEIAHDFNNLLSASYNLFNLAAKHLADPPRARRFLQSAYSGFAELAEMVRVVFQGPGGRDSLTKIDDLVKDLRAMVLVFVDPVKYKVEFSFSASPHFFGIDRIQLSRVVGNIITNAMQAMPKGGILFINVENVEVDPNNALSLGSGPYLKISITDTGEGIDDDSLVRVFEPNFTTRPDGSGLGLSIAKALVERRGGYIEVSSQRGEGTTFAIYLPAEKL